MSADLNQPAFDHAAFLREETDVVSSPRPPARLSGLLLGEILVAQRAVTPEKVEEALVLQKERGTRLGAILVSLKAVSDEQVARALGAQLDIPVLDELRMSEIDLELVRAVPINFARQTRTLPLWREGEVALVAVADPLDVAALDHLRSLIGAVVEPRIVTEAILIDALNAAYDRAMHAGILNAFKDSATGDANNAVVKNFGEAVKITAFAYEGWVCATAINAELKDSKRNLPKALVGGTIAVLVIYLIR